MRTLSAFLLGFLFLPCLSFGEEVVLKDGRSLFGKVQKEEDHLVVVDFLGQAVILKEEVKEVKNLDLLRKEYALFPKGNGNAAYHLDLGMWCWKRGLEEEARTHLLRVIEEDPENPAARLGLGHLKVRGIWVEAGTWTRLPDEKKTWIRWIPQGEKGKVQVWVGEEPNDVYFFVRQACKGTPEEIRRAEASLCKMPASQKQEGLIQALNDRSPAIRAYAIESLKESPGKETGRALAQRALCDGDPKIRALAVKHLAEGSFPEVPELLLEGLTSKNAFVRLNAIQSLSSFPSIEAANALIALLQSDQPVVPRANIFVGRQTAYVRDFDAAIATAASIADPVIAHQLEGVVLDVKILGTHQRTVCAQQGAAHRALCRIAGKDLGRNPAAWREWAQKAFGNR